MEESFIIRRQRFSLVKMEKILAFGNRRTGRKTRIGHNGDAILVRPDIGVFAVFDGVSKAMDPDLAARIASDCIEASLEKRIESFNKKIDEDAMKKYIADAVAAANAELYKHCLDEDGKEINKRIMATTASLVVVNADRWYAANIGDSTTAVLGYDGRFEHVGTEDRDERGFITKCLGERKELDDFALSYSSMPLFDEQGGLLVRDIFLGTDGVSGNVSDEDIKNILAKTQEPSEAVMALLDKSQKDPSAKCIRAYAEKRGKSYGSAKSTIAGRDDMAAIVIKPVSMSEATSIKELMDRNEELQAQLEQEQAKSAKYDKLDAKYKKRYRLWKDRVADVKALKAENKQLSAQLKQAGTKGTAGSAELEKRLTAAVGDLKEVKDKMNADYNAVQQFEQGREVGYKAGYGAAETELGKEIEELKRQVGILKQTLGLQEEREMTDYEMGVKLFNEGEYDKAKPYFWRVIDAKGEDTGKAWRHIEAMYLPKEDKDV